jgi:hypothetical protein
VDLPQQDANVNALRLDREEEHHGLEADKDGVKPPIQPVTLSEDGDALGYENLGSPSPQEDEAG